ncbi:SAP domain-containing protein [Abeliophyllum distichum]|uniref:SAP domain-containing protein n=1 Tax=Abeliophyllum distichum TaxID=126358 RepID=A0ABD1SVW8_9LAMI
MSSPYAVLDNRPIDQWKVTELKEELKRRKLIVRGLKEDLVKRLDEAIRNETESASGNTDNGFGIAPQPELQSEQAKTEPFVSETATDLKDTGNNFIEKVDGGTPEIEIDDSIGTLDKGKLVEEELIHGSDSVSVEREQVTTVETNTMVERLESVTAFDVQPLNSNETKNGNEDSTAQMDDDDSKSGSDSVSVEREQVTTIETNIMVERLESVTAFDVQPLNSNETKNGNEDSTVQMDDDDSKSSQQDAKLHLSDSNSQVSEVSESGVSNAQNCEIPTETWKSEIQPENDGAKSLHMDAELNSSDINYQVSEVNSELKVQEISDSVSTESVSITEKNELKDDIIADDVKFLEVKPEMVQSSSINVVPDGGESMDVEETRDDKVFLEETGGTKNVDTLENNNTVKLVSREKLSLDQNSVDDSMEEDISESKQMDSKSNYDEMREEGEKTEMPAVKEEDILESKPMDSNSNFDEMRDRGEKTEIPVGKEEDRVDVVGYDKIAESLVSNVGNKNEPAQTSVKRKSTDQGAVGNNDVVKRQRRWNSEALKVPELQSSNIMGSITPKDPLKPAFRRSFSRSDSTVSEETLKERVVPPSAKPHTTALRIDNFLRPFTLKAVQELLGKTGTITNFWMDHIKTHCYVSYSSVEEAVETRNAMYNLQWPPNGGRLLVAEFVDPQEVKTRVEAPPLSPATPSGSAHPNFPPAQPTVQLPQPSPHQQVQRQHLPPPPSLPPPPPLANLPPAREHPQLEREPLQRGQPLPARERLSLPPPPPLVEKVDPPIVTLDDLFRKTKATPRIYYLPLSGLQVLNVGCSSYPRCSLPV